MAKNLKINIKNAQIAEAINLGSLKKAVLKKKEEAIKEETTQSKPSQAAAPRSISKSTPAAPVQEEKELPKVKARSKSAFAETSMPTHQEPSQPLIEEPEMTLPEEEFKENIEEVEQPQIVEESFKSEAAPAEIKESEKPSEPVIQKQEPVPMKTETAAPPPKSPVHKERREITLPPKRNLFAPKEHAFLKDLPVREKFGPTGKHVKDLLPKKPVRPEPAPQVARRDTPYREASSTREQAPRSTKPAPRVEPPKVVEQTTETKAKPPKFKEYRDLKPTKRTDTQHRQFDSRDRQGLRQGDDDLRWRKKKAKSHKQEDDSTIRPSTLKIRVPIILKDLAEKMKLKASQLVQKLFMQGVIVTLNDILEDETMIQLLGQEFGCEITIDTSEQERVRITDKTISQEIEENEVAELMIRPPVVAFMGHVDHGKTSLIDYIRKSNRASGEAGAITQHIGAFMSSTAVGNIAILDTPGHEAFSAMRARGANVTDIVVLVVAGDEGMRQQTIEAVQHAKAAGVTIVVAINKADKPNFNAENVYRQLSEQSLLPEVWGGQTITINCSAITGQGVKELLEMLALQAEVLELKANPKSRARGTVIESEMHKGLGAKATVLVQNGTLRKGDSLVFNDFWGRIKTMYDENGKEIEEAGPSHPVEITGLSGLPEAGKEFIVVKSEKEAKDIADIRSKDLKATNLLQKKKLSMENMLLQASESGKKILNLVIRADVQGSLEALKVALEKIESSKAELNIIFTGVGEISESDIQLAAASKAVVLGFHTQIESHADLLVKEMGVIVKVHDIIYHAIDEVKQLMQGLLDRIAIETERGKALVKATFKSSHLGLIAGCQVIEGTVHRNHLLRIKRGDEVVFKGSMASLKKVKEDVREVAKGLECGILIANFNDVKENDIIETYEITYLNQEL